MFSEDGDDPADSSELQLKIEASPATPPLRGQMTDLAKPGRWDGSSAQQAPSLRRSLWGVLFAIPLTWSCSASLSGSSSEESAQADDSAGGSASDPLVPGVLDNSRDTVAAQCESRGGELDVGLTRLRRLTRLQLNNTLRDLLNLGEQDFAELLSPDEKIGPFYSNGIAPITGLLVQQHHELAERVAAEAAIGSTGLLPCDLSADPEDACLLAFVQDFGVRAFRRPLAPEEVTGLVELYHLGREGADVTSGLTLLLSAFLAAPSFLYHADTGADGSPAASPTAASPYALAARLSYFLWNSMPDAQLIAAAQNGTLSQPAVYQAEVERLLNDPKAEHAIAHFHQQWLGLGELLEKEKDLTEYPEFTPALAQEMLNEQALFAQNVILHGDSLLRTLLTADYSYGTAGVLGVYGASAAAIPGQPVPLPAGQRAGLLTQPGFLASHAKRAESSPVHRGIVVRENILCELIPPPPPGVDVVLPPRTETSTTRERFAQHLEDPSCAGCHKMMDPIGLGFEHYDAIGKFRTMEGGLPVNATGEVLDNEGASEGTFDGVLELASLLADSTTVSDCVARQWFRYSLGRVESTSDSCSIQSISEGFEASGGNVRELIRAIAQSPAFLNLRTTNEGTL